MYSNFPTLKVTPYTHTFQMLLEPGFEGLSLSEIYHRKFPHLSLPEWNAIAENGRIRVNGVIHPPAYKPEAGALLEHTVPNRTEPEVPDAIRILHEDENVLVAFKPAPMPVHPSGRYLKNTLTSILEERGYGSLHIINRLDSQTSGIVIFARNPVTAASLQSEIKGQTVLKKYHARVFGDFPETLDVQVPIRRKEGYLFECHSDGKPARTSFRKLESILIDGKPGSIVECIPHTGRTHQIRLHLKHAGFPIWNDTWYSVENRDIRKSYADTAIDLCAVEYIFTKMRFSL